MSIFIAYTTLIFALLTLLIGYFSVRQILFCVRFGAASKNWPRAEGVVVHSAMSEAPLPLHQDERKQTIEYEYSVNGKLYQSDRLSFNHAILPWLLQSRQENRFKGYAVGTPISVFYDPSDPTNATLVKGIRIAGITSNFLTGAASIIGGSLLLILGFDAF